MTNFIANGCLPKFGLFPFSGVAERDLSAFHVTRAGLC